MDFGLIALCLTVAHIVLAYIAPKTKTKGDDTALAVVKKAQEMLPAAKAVADAAKPTSTPRAEVEGFGRARDHR